MDKRLLAQMRLKRIISGFSLSLWQTQWRGGAVISGAKGEGTKYPSPRLYQLEGEVGLGLIQAL